MLYLTRKCEGRGLKSVEEEYKSIKIKAAIKRYENTDPSMSAVRKFEENSMKSGCHSFVKDAQIFAQEHGMHLQLNYPEPMCIKEDGEKISV